ncbi:MAG: chloride channel protein [gamma proteobacterium endosymbiont of Lamellibrachia anaximandri]|nr:chloride channel protein [gamma proteobacterium endosymbiont of Lamellibrachia anaximandri]MBL3616974.1 chloride channel protein [gamma proteobacterium endosymbiont of Lamellibrachia anaximandri]
MHRIRIHLSRPDALIQLSGLGLITGFLAGGVIVAFRLAVEGSQAGLLPGGLPENYEALPPLLRFLLPVFGSLLLGFIFHNWSQGLYVLGIARVMERLAYHQGYLTLREFILQFVGAAIAIISGHSVGREGPHVFLGAASGSLLGQQLSLPNNTIRTLVGCGTAAGIAASFDTPLAGVIFALEVIMMEYTLASFMPIILAAVSANSISIYILGDERAFDMSVLTLGSMQELPILLLLGLVVGAAAAGFNQLIQITSTYSKPLAFWQRTLLGGIIVGLLGVIVPQVLGIGYDTVNDILLGELAIELLLVLVFAKVLATSASIGLGIPGGMIGPALFIGAAIGGFFAPLAGLLIDGEVSDPGLYALIGMGAMMGASLQAPLAALTAIVELTFSPQIVMPGMLVIVVASLTSSELFRKQSLFITILKSSGLDYRTDPVMQSLRRVGVASVMNNNFLRCEREMDHTSANHIIKLATEWLVINKEDEPAILMRGLDLARYLEESEEQNIDLLSIPARRYQLAGVTMQASLQEALEKLQESGAEALFVERQKQRGAYRILGILTREQIDSAYRF